MSEITPSSRFKLGRAKPHFTPHQLKAGRYMKNLLESLPAAPPVSADFVSAVMRQVPAANDDYPWDLEANDTVGCCTFSWMAHGLMMRSANTGSIIIPTPEQTLAAYAACTGYDASQVQPDGSNPTDRGATISDVCQFMQTNGLLGHKSTGFAPIITDQVGPSQITRIKQGIQIFGAVNLGVNLPNSAQDQFDAKLPWTVSGDLRVDGGHCVGAVKYDNSYLYVVTWGRLQKVTWAWAMQFIEEGWVQVFPDFITQKGVTPVGFTPAQVNADLMAIAA